MTVDEILDTLDQLLREESSAIVRLQAERVERIAAEKEALMNMLRDARPSLDETLRSRLLELRGALRQNALLLAHSRDCLRDALAAFHRVGVSAHSPSSPAPASRLGVRVSILG